MNPPFSNPSSIFMFTFTVSSRHILLRFDSKPPERGESNKKEPASFLAGSRRPSRLESGGGTDAPASAVSQIPRFDFGDREAAPSTRVTRKVNSLRKPVLLLP